MITLPPHFTLLQVVPALDTGGVEQTTLDISRAVKAAGGRSLVASRGGRLEGALSDAGGELIRLPVDSKNPLIMTANSGALARVIRDEAVSLIHARSRAPAFSALAAARRTDTPFVATYHGVYRSGSSPKRWYNSIMTRGDRVIANSAYTRSHLIAEHRVDAAKVVAIPRGVDFTRFDPDAVGADRVAAMRRAWGLEGDARPVVLLAGRLTPWKGQGLLIEALARLGERDVVIVLAGDDQGRTAYREQLEQKAKDLGVAERVRIVGHVTDMPAAYLAADLVCAPSLEPEAFGRTGVEPQAMGRPVLAAAHGAAPETVVHGESGWLVPPRDPHAWAQALDRALSVGPSGWARMGGAGRARARRLYGVEAMTAATLAVYAEVLASRASAAR